MSGFLYYVTYKYVLLKDARLGLLYYLLAALAILYTVVEIFISKGYLKVDSRPQGMVKLILADDFSNSGLSPTELPYCSGKTACRFMDPWELNWPEDSNAVTIMSYGKDRVQVLRNETNTPADEYEITEERVYFTQTPELVVVKVDHAVVASLFTDSRGRDRLAASHRQLRGFLVDREGSIIRELSAGVDKPDKLSLQELLAAAGVDSLDVPSDALSAEGRTFRERGIILRVTIFYQNWFTTWFGTSDIEYTYHVCHVPFMDHTAKQITALLSRDEVLSGSDSHTKWRLQRKRYSIRVEFKQAGSLGMFSIPNLLLKLVSGMGLLTLTATVIDTLALYILPSRKDYRKFVYDESTVIKKSKEEKDKPETTKEKEN